MPSYNYQCECGKVTERFCSMNKIPASVKCEECGKKAIRKWEAPAAHCRYSYLDKVNGNPRFNRGKG